MPKTRSVNVAARAIASSKVVTGKLYLQGMMGPNLKTARALLALIAWSCSCCGERNVSESVAVGWMEIDAR